MTPERIEEIKRILGSGRTVHLGREEVYGLLAALEESQQQLAEEKKWRQVEHEVAGGYHRELVQAQQTIAKQREALQSIYEESEDRGARHCAAGALGIEWDNE